MAAVIIATQTFLGTLRNKFQFRPVRYQSADIFQKIVNIPALFKPVMAVNLYQPFPFGRENKRFIIIRDIIIVNQACGVIMFFYSSHAHHFLISREQGHACSAGHFAGVTTGCQPGKNSPSSGLLYGAEKLSMALQKRRCNKNINLHPATATHKNVTAIIY
ncbi:hypothetical protein [Pantoea ananatis]|uniref:hypothetical protein n=1 Tax=Pantoea ananas TaxID=553 RepID=UPI0032F047FF